MPLCSKALTETNAPHEHYAPGSAEAFHPGRADGDLLETLIDAARLGGVD
jgi:hypothetical protein